MCKLTMIEVHILYGLLHIIPINPPEDFSRAGDRYPTNILYGNTDSNNSFVPDNFQFDKSIKII